MAAHQEAERSESGPLPWTTDDAAEPTEGMRLLAEYERGLKDHTYLTF